MQNKKHRRKLTIVANKKWFHVGAESNNTSLENLLTKNIEIQQIPVYEMHTIAW
jgi:hypothetical protein